MITFAIKDMTCGHCVRSITAALHAVDPQANVTIELDQQLVMIEPVTSNAPALKAAIEQAGFQPQAVLTAASDTASEPRAKTCCGGCH